MKERIIVTVGLAAALCIATAVFAVESEAEMAARVRPVSLDQTVNQLPGTGVSGPVVDFGPPATGPNLKWATPDAVITNLAETEVTPSVASAPNGELFAAVDQAGSGRILIYHSTDGGQNWAWLASFVDVATTRNPALSYAENSGDRWLVLVYELVTSDIVRSLSAFVVDVDDPQGNSSFVDIDDAITWTNAGTELHPQVTCDFPDWSSLVYFYVTWAIPSIDYYPVYFSRSTDQGQTWTAPLNITGGSENTSAETRPEIAYSAHRNDVYVAFTKPGWTGSAWEPQVWVTNNTASGGSGSWLPAVQVTTSSRADINPSVAAAWDSDTVMVAWTSVYSVDDSDVQSSYSLDGGTVWSSVLSFPSWTFEYEDSIDLAVSQAASGRFHAVYRHDDPAIASGGDIWYSWAEVSSPGLWSSALDVDAETYASGLSFYPRPSICVDLSQAPEDEAALAWSRWSPSYRSLFDSAVLGNFDGIFEDDFESGDDSAWSSSTP